MRKPKLKVKKVTFYEFSGPDLAIAREERGISREIFCLEMGPRWYPTKLQRMEDRKSNTVTKETLDKILDILGEEEDLLKSGC